MKPLWKLSRACACAALGMCLLSAVAGDSSAASPPGGGSLLVQACALNARIGQVSANAITGNSDTSFATLKAQHQELLALLAALQARPSGLQTTPLIANFQSLNRNLSALIEQESALQILAMTISQMKAMQSKMTNLSEEIVTLTARHNGHPQAVMAATQLLYRNQRLMYNMDAVYANEHIEPEVSYFIDNDSSGIQALTQGLLHGSSALSLTAPHPQTRLTLQQWVAAYSALERHIAATRKVLPQVLAAKRSMEALRQDNTALMAHLTTALAPLD